MFKPYSQSGYVWNYNISYCSCHSPCFCYTAFLLRPAKCPSSGLLHLPCPPAWNASLKWPGCSSLPLGLCSNTFSSDRASLSPTIKEQEMTAISPTMFPLHLAPSTYVFACLLSLSPYLLECKFHNGSSRQSWYRNHYCHFQMVKLRYIIPQGTMEPGGMTLNRFPYWLPLVVSQVPDFDSRSLPVNRLHPDKYQDSKNSKLTLCPPKELWIIIICY